MAYSRDIKNVIGYAQKEDLQETEEVFSEKICSVLAENELAIAEAEKERLEKEKANQTITDLVKELSIMKIGFDRISELT